MARHKRAPPQCKCKYTLKRSFTSRAAAEAFILTRSLQRPNHRAHRAYQCPFCHLWHTTSQGQRTALRRRS